MAVAVLKTFFRRHRAFRNFVGSEVYRLFVISLALGFFSFGIDALFLLAFQYFLFSVGILSADKLFWHPPFVVTAALGLGALLLASTFKTAVNYFKAYLLGRVNQVFMRTMKGRIVDRAFKSEVLPPIVDVTEMLGTRLSQTGVVLSHLNSLVISVISLVMLVGLSLKIAPREFIISALLLAFTIWPVKSLNRRAKEAGKKSMDFARTAAAQLNAGLRNYFLLRIYGQDQDYCSEVKQSLYKVEDLAAYVTKMNGLSKNYPFIIGIFIVTSTAYLGAQYLGTNPGHLIAFLYLFIRISNNAGEIVGSYGSVQFGIQNVRSLQKWIANTESSIAKKTLPESKSKEEKVSKIEITGTDLRFSYPGGNQELFGGISFSMTPGTFTVITGRSGAGKSTLLSLILGLNNPTSGQIKIGGVVASEARYDLFPHIGYVGPDPYIIPGTLRENLLFGYPSLNVPPTDDALWSALAAASVDLLVRKFPKGLDQLLSEFAGISTGQRQRISFARALLRQPTLLILDEATANLDKETEMSILNLLLARKSSLTVIGISHKDTFRQCADQIIHLGKEFI